MFGTSLALTVDAVSVIGKALTSLYSHGNLPVPDTIICESDDTWVDGEFFNEALRQVTLDQSMTGKIIFDGHGSRTNSTITGITRTNEKFQKV
uniref:Receptor ligand binding region domain-containing protein n=1 Tax=Panagrolaimus superbus TaxID=310955 RepID=A0A914YR12_9BILA